MQPIYIIYGTESFNTEDLAERAGEVLAALDLPVPVKVVDMDDFDTGLLPALHTLLVMTSTYGNGDPPSNAEALHSYLMGDDAPRLPGLRFSVCALGDSVYPHFAQCGKDFDRRLEELGATRFVDRQDCDVDYEPPFEAWIEQVAAALPGLGFADQRAAPAAAASGPASAPLGTRKRPCTAVVRENRVLNPGGSKETRHVVLSLPPEVAFEPGDSIALRAANAPALVQEVLEKTGLSGGSPVQLGEQMLPLAEALSAHLDLALVDARLIALAAAAAPSSVFSVMQVDAGLRQGYAARHHVVDLLGQVSLRPTAQAFVDALRPLAPRLYSVASSPLAHPGEVHLLVAVVRYTLADRPRAGVFSAQISERTAVGDDFEAYVHPTPGFHLVEDDRDVILIGPGTGVAPYRGFLQTRAARGAKGRTWLVFGERNAAHDFYYRDELAAWQAAGTLTRLDTAFSRDTAEKVYVQHRLAAAGADVAAWLRGGAAVYVCGDAHHMAPDVHRALRQILMDFEGLDEAAADGRLAALEAEGRYRRDVY
ncbi:MAG: sulfite reductase flavoprotein subunit alpha [bacterium]